MKKSLNVISEVITWLELFTDENPESEIDLKSFIIWLNSRLFADEHTDHKVHKEDMLDMELTFLLVLQHRHYKTYAKNALGDSILSSPEGFSFLYHLAHVDSYRKMELIKMHLMEPPSGIEVLKRLLKKSLIEEFADPDDKRARRIRITQKGKTELQKVLPKMEEVFHSMAAGMTLNAKLHVVSFLKNMNDFHARHTGNLY